MLDLARDARLVLAVASDEVDLPVVLRHHLERDARAVGGDRRRVEALGALMELDRGGQVVGGREQQTLFAAARRQRPCAQST